jgi:hypothetical protein
MACALLTQLVDAGLTVSRDGDQLIVTPRDRLTDELRATIRQRKTELLAAINPTEQSDLNARIRKMAQRWGYSPDELQEVLTGAQSDPLGWMAWTERDERDFGGCVTQQDFAKAYARVRGLE